MVVPKTPNQVTPLFKGVILSVAKRSRRIPVSTRVSDYSWEMILMCFYNNIRDQAWPLAFLGIAFAGFAIPPHTQKFILATEMREGHYNLASLFF